MYETVEIYGCECECYGSDCWNDLFFFKQKAAYEMRISDWSSDVCSSDLVCADCAMTQPGRHRDPRPAGRHAGPAIQSPGIFSGGGSSHDVRKLPLRW